MGFERVRHFNFRNLNDATIDLAAGQIFLLGENGQGKSNFLESLYLLSYGASFRTRRDAEMVRHEEREMAVDGDISVEGGARSIQIRYVDGSKQIRIDNETLRDRRDMISIAPSVVFRHGDMEFVSGPPEMQRLFVDQTLSMGHELYVDDLRRYKRILRNRNIALKQRELEMVPIYERELAEVGLEITRRRRRVIREFNVVFVEEYRAIAGLDDDLTLVYRPSWRDLDSVEAIVERLAERRAHDIDQRTTTSGPHRDRLLFRYRDRDFLQVASTGQIRLVSLILRVAQARYYGTQRGRKPILLLDDVLLELDPVRRSRFVERLPPSDQRLFTFLPGEPYDAYRDDTTLIYYVEDGGIREQKGG